MSSEYTDAYELGLTKNMPKGMLQLSPFYRRTSNVIRVDINTTDTFEGREGDVEISFKNLATSNSGGPTSPPDLDRGWRAWPARARAAQVSRLRS